MYREMSPLELRAGLRLAEDYAVDGFIAWGGSVTYPYDLLDMELGQRQTGPGRRLADDGVLGHVAEFSVDGRTFWFAMGYGGAMLSELCHLACLFGSRTNICLGSCGGLGPGQRALDVIVPTASFATESSAAAYVDHPDHLFPSDAELSDRLAGVLSAAHVVHRGKTMTCQATFAETWPGIVAWSEAGYIGVEMECATIFAVSEHFGVPAAGLLRVADNLIEEETVFSNSYVHWSEAKEQLLRDMLSTALDAVTR